MDIRRKPYLLSLASNSKGVSRYLDSLKNLQDSVEWISVEFDPSFIIHDSIADHLSDFRRYWPGITYPGNLARFEYVPDSLDEDRWWIFTDTSDVIFQAPIRNLDKTGQDILVSCENELFGESWFFKPMIEAFAPKLDALKDRPIYCMGTWAMKGRKAKELLRYLKDRAPEFGNHPQIDQPLLNLWLMEQDFGEDMSLFATLHQNYQLGRVTKDEVGRFWQDGVLPAIIHGNGGSKENLPAVL